MQNAPLNYNTIYAEGDYDVEYKVNIDGIDFPQEKIWSMKTSRACFSSSTFFVGNAMVGQIDLTITKPDADFARMACIKPYIRLRSRHRNLVSGWLQKGEFYVDTRPADESDTITTLNIQGFDLMRKANIKYPTSSLTWSSSEPSALMVVQEIASFLFGVKRVSVMEYPPSYIDSDTITLLNNNPHVVGFPAQYTIAEVLGSIATMYGGNFIISDTGKIKLARLMDLPTETFYLVNEKGNYITFGSGANATRILLMAGG